MPKISIAGLDLAKNVFQFHGVSEEGEVILKKRLRRNQMLPFFRQLPPCLIGIEACGSAHFWAQTLQGFGHEVRLMDARFVKAYLKGNKNDAHDAEAICEAVQRPNMRFVPIKSTAQQQVLHWHRSRSQLMQQRIALGNHMRSLLYEMGISFARGASALKQAIPTIIADTDERLGEPDRQLLALLWEQYCSLQTQINEIESWIADQMCEDRNARLLMSTPGIGVLTASALAATIGDGRAFHNGRQLAAYLGLVPRQHSSGGKTQLLGISKRGNTQLRTLLIHGSRAVFYHSHRKSSPQADWLASLAQRRHKNVAIVALANKTARRAWAVLQRGTPWIVHPVGV